MHLNHHRDSPGTDAGTDDAAPVGPEAQERVVSLLESMDEAFVSVDPNWVITYVNGVAARIVGKRPEEIVGRNHWDVWPTVVGTETEANYRRAVAQK